MSSAVLPDWLDPEAWSAFCDMRKAKGKRAPFTEAAARRIVYMLDRMRKEGQNPTDVLWQSVVNGWSGVFPVKVQVAAEPQGVSEGRRWLEERDKAAAESVAPPEQVRQLAERLRRIH